MTTSSDCPKCHGQMVDGSLEDTSLFVADKAQRHSFWSFDPKVSLARARACLSCGYVEIFLDPHQLQKYVKWDTTLGG